MHDALSIVPFTLCISALAECVFPIAGLATAKDHARWPNRLLMSACAT